MEFLECNKLKPGDRVAILSPSLAAPGLWPHVYALGVRRLKEVFGLEAVEFPATRKVGATQAERAQDLIAAFVDPDIQGVISSLGGDDQVTYIKSLPKGPFREQPKPFFGFSDNTHFMNFLWLCGVPSYYGGALFTQFAEPGRLHAFTRKYLELALFKRGEYELEASCTCSDVDLDWDEPHSLEEERSYEPDPGWEWAGSGRVQGVSWGGCLESIDELLRHGVPLPSLEDFDNVILVTETSEELPEAGYVYRVYRALGERGILRRVQALLVGRPKAWSFDQQNSPEQRQAFRQRQREAVLRAVREYHPGLPVVLNMDFGHTGPQIPIPYGRHLRVDTGQRRIWAEF